MFRRRTPDIEVLLVHPGGPYWTQKDEGAWTLPKGEYEDGEEALAAAQREFHEETGFVAHAPFLELGSVRQKSGKVVVAWAFEGDCNPALRVLRRRLAQGILRDHKHGSGLRCFDCSAQAGDAGANYEKVTVHRHCDSNNEPETQRHAAPIELVNRPHFHEEFIAFMAQ